MTPGTFTCYTATWGWDTYQNRSQHEKLTLEEKNSPTAPAGPRTQNLLITSLVLSLTTELSPLPTLSPLPIKHHHQIHTKTKKRFVNKTGNPDTSDSKAIDQFLLNHTNNLKVMPMGLINVLHEVKICSVWNWAAQSQIQNGKFLNWAPVLKMSHLIFFNVFIQYTQLVNS